jgi:hypothetical protein
VVKYVSFFFYKCELVDSCSRNLFLGGGVEKGNINPKAQSNI